MPEDNERELLLGEVTPEVRAFLESMGKTVQPLEHHATKTVGRLKYQSRHTEHFPPAWSPLTSNNWPNVHKSFALGILRQDELVSFELGQRVATAFRFQRDLLSYLNTLPHYALSSSEKETEDV